ncbi:hypothetical protein [Collinsella ihumii]|uniref:hypothetical protein n=1 Tax=Collinsella ihumii TaxID=1720204 RepID=UPI000A900467|nr:hypothetical protein [Collinsella ihumii]
MNIFTHFSLRSLFGNRTRTIVSIIGIALSCALVCAVLTSVVSMSNMLYERTAADEGSWQVEAANVPADARSRATGASPRGWTSPSSARSRWATTTQPTTAATCSPRPGP